MAKNANGYYFYFTDGFHMWARGFNREEKASLEREHGKMVRKVAA